MFAAPDKCRWQILRKVWPGRDLWDKEIVLGDGGGGGVGGGGGCILAGRDLPWEESRSEGVGKEKLGHVEKSSCNDPTQGLADSLHVCLLMSTFISFKLWLHLSLLSDLQSSFSLLFYILSLLHPLFFFLLFHLFFLLFPPLSDHSFNNYLQERRNTFPSSNLDISRSNGVTFVQKCDISQREAQREDTWQRGWW